LARFFGEAFDREDRQALGVRRFAHAFDVAEAGVWARWGNAQDYDAIGGARQFQGGADDFAVFVGLGDVMVGGEDGQDGVAIFFCVADVDGGQGDGGGGVAAEGFA
jgi:hypothetical protein